MNHVKTWASVCVVVALCACPTQANVVIDTVHVGNPGNAGELSGAGAGGFGTDRICGAVDYMYNVGKYEVTAGQYTEFLNAVAKTDTYGLYNTSMASDAYGCMILRGNISGSYVYAVPDDWANRPVNYVSWGDAARFVNWLHNGQPTGMQDLARPAGRSLSRAWAHPGGVGYYQRQSPRISKWLKIKDFRHQLAKSCFRICSTRHRFAAGGSGGLTTDATSSIGPSPEWTRITLHQKKAASLCLSSTAKRLVFRSRTHERKGRSRRCFLPTTDQREPPEHQQG